jgi:DNA-binding SARP family transcriptional activator/tetratricopeptide (TPR) repeat protein/TolB-like protein
VSRERLASFFWSEADDARATHSLRQARYAMRQEIGCDVVRVAGAMHFLEERCVKSDVAEFYAALASNDRVRATAIARGSFLDGFYLPGASAFERWVEEERAQLGTLVTATLTSLATDATRSGDRDAAAEWWRQLTTRDPLSGRFAVGYLKALAARGDRAEGLAFARQHAAIVRRELEADPDPEVRRLETELRAMPSPQIVRSPTELGPGSQPPGVDGSSSPGTGSPGVASRADAPRAPGNRRPPAQRAAAVLAVSLLALVITAGVARQRGWLVRADPAPILAVGFIREDAGPDSQRVGRVLTDMLATNLARVEGMSVLANTRLLELVRSGQDSATSMADAARRAGASDLLEGRLRSTPPGTLSLEMRRVDLRTGLVNGVYRVSAPDPYALVDSVTQAVARQLRLASPLSSVAHATTASATAYRLYTEGLRAYFQFDDKAAIRLMHAAVEEDSLFAMAAYYEVLAAARLGYVLPDGRHVTEARRAVLRLARRAPERERLTITANLLAEDWEPRALAVAESLTTRFPDDPRALTTLANARWQRGDWAGAAAAVERAIALDSAAESKDDPNCLLCGDFAQLGDIYLWWDSLPAAQRTARRHLAARPDAWQPWYLSALASARSGDSAATFATFRRLTSKSDADSRHFELRLHVTLGSYDAVEQIARPLLSSAQPNERGNGEWAYIIALRNQGRLREATLLHRTGTLPGLPAPAAQREPSGVNEAVLAMERGEPRIAAGIFDKDVRADMSRWAPGFAARLLTWNATLEGMALAAAGDTLAVRALVDSVERWGRASAYGRDRKAHHYLRGLLLAAAGHDEDAARELSAAIHSPSLGFTRVNYELAKVLLRLRRPAEAVAVLQPALRGEIDASNLYVTRTDLHELLAQSFAAANQPDSAAAHYRAVVEAWRNADPPFQTRRARAEEWLKARRRN